MAVWAGILFSETGRTNSYFVLADNGSVGILIRAKRISSIRPNCSTGTSTRNGSKANSTGPERLAIKCNSSPARVRLFRCDHISAHMSRATGNVQCLDTKIMACCRQGYPMSRFNSSISMKTHCNSLAIISPLDRLPSALSVSIGISSEIIRPEPSANAKWAPPV